MSELGWTGPKCSAILAPHQTSCPYCKTPAPPKSGSKVETPTKATKTSFFDKFNSEEFKAKFEVGFAKFEEGLKNAFVEIQEKAFEAYVREHTEEELIAKIKQIKQNPQK